MRRFQFDARSRRLWLLAALIATLMVFLEAKLSEKRERERLDEEPRADERADERIGGQEESPPEPHLRSIEFIELD